MRPLRSIMKAASVGVVLGILAFLLLVPAGAAAAEPTCNGRVMYTAAHEDDTLLFQSPDLYQDVASGRCVRTVFLTAGDAGRAQPYWSGRERGVEIAYAQMAAAPDEWEQSTVTVAGHAVTLATLTADPRISIVFMRLPDGGVNGTGFERYGFQSMMQLWFGTHPSPPRPSITSMTTVDGSATYDFDGLIATLAALIDEFEPTQIATGNYESAFFQGDHQDHIATGYFVREATLRYTGAYRLRAFMGYPVSGEPENVSGSLLGAKSFAFYLYGTEDSDACDSEIECAGTPYAEWLPRQYVTGSATHGVVADAGYAQTFAPGATVELDGSESSSESGGPLVYHWTQVGGPPVVLSSPSAVRPTFIAPGHPAVLRFSLTVRDGATTSAPDAVTISLPSIDPTPTAVVGPDQTVDSAATVQLDGTESWDPRSLPLEYAWLQVDGPSVDLRDSDTATPTFEAPTGPARLTFVLAVSNGADTSALATVTVNVNGIAPTFRTPPAAAFIAGEPAALQVDADGSPAPSIAIAAGALPPGLQLEAGAFGVARISGTPRATAPPGKSSVSVVTLRAENEAGSATQYLTFTVRTPAEVPPPEAPKIGATPGVAPTVAAPAAVYAFTGRRFSVPLTISGTPTPAVALGGQVPPGVALVGSGGGSFAIVGRASTPGRWRLDAGATNEAGSGRGSIVLTVNAPPRLSSPVLRVPAGTRSRRSVRVLSDLPATARCAGGAPGIGCRVIGRRIQVTVRPWALPRSATKLTVTASTPAGTVQRTLTVRTQARMYRR